VLSIRSVIREDKCELGLHEALKVYRVGWFNDIISANQNPGTLETYKTLTRFGLLNSPKQLSAVQFAV